MFYMILFKKTWYGNLNPARGCEEDVAYKSGESQFNWDGY